MTEAASVLVKAKEMIEPDDRASRQTIEKHHRGGPPS
jgi:hypothetical protein